MTTAMLNKVLIVDDDPAMLRILTAHLEAGGYEVYAASSGRRALELVQQEQPSYVVTDWEMPEMDGLELCRQIRQLELPHYLYLVFLTVRSSEDSLVAAMDAGADDFLTKPLRKHELLARLTAGARVLLLESHLSQLASHDALSGLPSRRAFDGCAETEWQRSLRCRLPLSAVMLDIDYFKQVNDTYGHPAGDEVIRRVAGLVRQHSRKSDIVCRYGGEEFCVLLPETNEASATVWAERLRCLIADTSIPIGTTSIQVTVSLGVTGKFAEMEDRDQLVALADQCLLSAKQQGRNRVISLQSLIDSGCPPGDHGASDSGLDGVLARDAMIPLSHCLHSDWPIVRAAAYFLQYRVSSAPVTDADGNLLGIVSEKDVLAVAHDPQAPDRHVNEMMRTNVITYEDDAPLARILSFLTRASMRSVVITSAGKPCGLISRAALVRWFLENRWKVVRSGDPRPQPAANGDATADGELVLVRLAGYLAEEADRLHRYLQSPRPDYDAAPLVGGVSRMQQLIDDLLAGSASGNRTGGGLPF
jgi:diguanylate cyclase (GGDEF)-like protein